MPRPTPPPGCRFDGCDVEGYAAGWCRKHYDRVLRTGGDPTPARRLTTEERFFEKVTLPSTCWEWTGARNAGGYGAFNVAWNDGKSVIRGAHRWAWEFFHGPIPEGLTLDHLCKNPPCVNPDHLEPVPNAVNVRRGDHARTMATICKRGHPLPDDRKPRRGCRICCNERRQDRRAAAKVAT